MRIKTNEQTFREFIEKVDPTLLAIARAQMVHNAEQLIKNKDEVGEDFKDAMCSGKLHVRTAEEIVKYLGWK